MWIGPCVPTPLPAPLPAAAAAPAMVSNACKEQRLGRARPRAPLPQRGAQGAAPAQPQALGARAPVGRVPDQDEPAESLPRRSPRHGTLAPSGMRRGSG